jgi:hypothetical protein
MISASSSVRARRRTATFRNISPRSTAGVEAHPLAASQAAAMAESTCSAEGSATEASAASV